MYLVVVAGLCFSFVSAGKKFFAFFEHLSGVPGLHEGKLPEDIGDVIKWCGGISVVLSACCPHRYPQLVLAAGGIARKS